MSAEDLYGALIPSEGLLRRLGLPLELQQRPAVALHAIVDAALLKRIEVLEANPDALLARGEPDG